MVRNIAELNIYPWTGHVALAGNKEYLWQECTSVLSLFGKTVVDARKKYIAYINEIEEMMKA